MRTLKVQASLEEGPVDCKVMHDFGNGRVVVNYDGANIFVKQIGPDLWDTDNSEATEEERRIIKFLDPNGTTTTETDPDGNTKTFDDT